MWKHCMCWNTGAHDGSILLKIEINPSTTRHASVLCKSNWVERRAPASYFCSKNALSKVMRTVFEVAPAGKYSRRLCVPSPEKSLFSSNCCFPKCCSLTVLHRVWQKQRGEGRKWGRDGMKGCEGRKEGGRKTEGRGWIAQTERQYRYLPGKSCQLRFLLPSLWHRLQCREHCSALLHELLCLYASTLLIPTVLNASTLYLLFVLIKVAMWSTPTFGQTDYSRTNRFVDSDVNTMSGRSGGDAMFSGNLSCLPRST